MRDRAAPCSRTSAWGLTTSSARRFSTTPRSACSDTRAATPPAESETSWNGWFGWGLYAEEGAVQDALWVCTPFNGAPASRRQRRDGGAVGEDLARGRRLSCRGAGARWNFGRRSRSAIGVQPGFLCGLRARSGRQQARGGVPRLHFPQNNVSSRARPQSLCPGFASSFVVSRTRLGRLGLAFASDRKEIAMKTLRLTRSRTARRQRRIRGGAEARAVAVGRHPVREVRARRTGSRSSCTRITRRPWSRSTSGTTWAARTSARAARASRTCSNT